jgi:hypothetical protein
MEGGSKMSDRPTPETDAFITSQDYSPTGHQWRCFARKLERERDEAREAAAKWESSSDAMERAGAEQARRADENREWALKAERERDEAFELLASEKITRNHIIKRSVEVEQERDEALIDRANNDIATMTRNHYERILRERDEWKNKAYSHATDYTLMEAKCFRLEQQLKEYDKLKS